MVDIFVEGRKLDVFEGLDFSFNYSIADIREPDKRSTEYTKTIKCPSTQNNDELFGHIYDVNIGNSHNSGIANINVNFNPNKKASVDVSQDGIRVMKGAMQLRRIVKNKSDMVYEVVFVGQLINIFSVLGDKQINGFDSSGVPYIDFSDLDHLYNMQNQQDSWVAPIGEGYIYPMIDYGKGIEYTNAGYRVYGVEDFNPAFYVRDIVDRIFEFAGFSYSSTFFDSDFFKRLVIPVGPDLFSQYGAVDPRLFQAGKDQLNSQILTRHDGNTGLGGVGNEDWFVNYNDSVKICFDDDSTLPNFDNGVLNPFGNFLIPTVQDGVAGDYEWYVNGTNAGVYNLYSTIKLELTEIGDIAIVRAQTNESTRDIIEGKMRLIRIRDNQRTVMGETNWAFSLGNAGSGSVLGYHQSLEVTVQVDDVITYDGDTYHIDIYAPNDSNRGWTPDFGLFYPDPNNTSATTYYHNFFVTEGVFRNEYAGQPIVEGEMVYMTGNAPQLGMSDLLLNLFKMFNLYLTPSVDIENHLIIETRDTFYSGGVTRDWTHKLDHGQRVEITPLALLTAKEYEYTYDGDGDYYNTRYEDAHGHVHGRSTITSENEFINNTNTTSVTFSPSPLVNDGDSSRIIPKIYNDDAEEVGPTDFNSRILYFGGVLTSTPQWHHAQFGEPDTYRGEYPYAGHLTHPIAPAQDIHFGLPLELFYAQNANTGPISVTTNNLFNTFHKDHINEIINKDSKLLTAQFYLGPMDIHTLDFRNQIIIDNSIWRINKIENFNPFNESTTKVELIKVVDKKDLPFVKAGLLTGSTSTPTKTPSKKKSNQYPKFQGEVKGRNNEVDPTANNFDVNGDNNIIERGANNIAIQGNNNIVREGVTDVTLINTNDVIVTRSGSTYVNNRGQEGADIVDGGEDEVRDPFSEVPVFTIDGGEGDAEQYSESAIYILDGGHG